MTENGKVLPDLAAYGPQFRVRLAYGKVPRPPYAYGMLQATRIAERLGLPKISAIEFGVAGGEGLVAMEKIAREVEKELLRRVVRSRRTGHFRICGFVRSMRPRDGTSLPGPLVCG
jgi:hypothetical protein